MKVQMVGCCDLNIRASPADETFHQSSTGIPAGIQGRSQDVSLRGVSVRAKRAGYAGTFLGERSESVTPAAGERFLSLTARKTSRCNLAI